MAPMRLPRLRAPRADPAPPAEPAPRPAPGPGPAPHWLVDVARGRPARQSSADGTVQTAGPGAALTAEFMRG